MSSARLLNEGEARALCQRETGRVFKRGELVHYSHEQLLDVKGEFDDSFMIYGTLVVNSFDLINGWIEFQYRGITTFKMAPLANLSPTQNSNIFNYLMIDSIPTLDQCKCTFYGYRFERERGYVDQEKNLTPGAGWTNAGTSYTHVSGTTEQIYLGAWTVSSKLRVTITFTGITAGNVRLQMDNSGTFATITSDGTYVVEVTTNGSDGALFIVPSNTFNGTYDNATFKVEKLTYI
jgi:hypothetical protein